jgi:hypothetical protein
MVKHGAHVTAKLLVIEDILQKKANLLSFPVKYVGVCDLCNGGGQFPGAMRHFIWHMHGLTPEAQAYAESLRQDSQRRKNRMQK